MMGKATTCLDWDVGGGRYSAVSIMLQGLDRNSDSPDCGIAPGVEEGAEAVARHGGTLKLMPASRRVCETRKLKYEPGK